MNERGDGQADAQQGEGGRGPAGEKTAAGDSEAEFREFTIPIETARGQKAILSGRMQTELDLQTQEEIAKLLAEALVADYQRTLARWEGVRRQVSLRGNAPARNVKDDATAAPTPEFQADLGNVEGWDVIVMRRAAWEQFRLREGTLVDVELERAPTGGVDESASVIACLAQQYFVHTARIEIWRYDKKHPPQPSNLDSYMVLENLTRRVNVRMLAERASTEDSPKLRKYLREHVFLVKEQVSEGHWRAGPVLERLVFLTA